MHNPVLADERGIPDVDRKVIDFIHERIDDLITKNCTKPFSQQVYNEIEQLENELQKLWQFSVDPEFHRYKHDYEFKCSWVGRCFVCNTTDKMFYIPSTVKERDFFAWGEAYVDVGRYNFYSRFSNCSEVE